MDEVETVDEYVAEIDAAVYADPKRAARLRELHEAAETTVSVDEMRSISAEMAELQREGLAELNERRVAAGLPTWKPQPPQV
ncbi:MULTISPECIES: hypothetical protein [unclassified Streptomyces]|uniref:hypothetical protein n=1 Tax=unclassified Streptomyces TaxID=2593676 RepID=UPI002DDACA5C|nr:MULTISPECIES: hypothetical protein [unclassified Streptomyces]WSA96627.1 hypothetical protein OIE63_37535 [Streptomyces sp. NBC_01795]WSB81041.1 hypothetical protein OHB04_38650 [Streptomyces sp. NBC_01775]WSS10749.1 hypothetical protein OG533_01610 [Streptomyces sp. NBC_01186]WSS39445.1 hypothetical protein OG220_01640 [Streptomyces sp. NBC_01187]